ncbi:hypothetical protein L6452_27871 [Arctium lappa]|uniref:Uncharacterized protein n=1 Tax=Arctium lappa TaxID=4217 RepID=A0ACB9A177_ARCLA|nr:hypothetical protein L6452_27871 [Arctium lappa]
MASMAFIDEHNEIAMLQKPKQAAGFHQIVDFLKTSHIAHALTVSPTIFIEHQRQFWANATIVAENGVQMIKTRVCDQPLTVTEEVIRISLRLDDASGITSIPSDELFSTLSRMGYQGQMGIFKFFKAKFSPQWRFFAHTLMHCISKKTTGWSQFSSPIAYALVCLSTARKFNFSQMIFHDLVSNLDNKKSFFMYPRFVQEAINHELTDIPQPVGVYVPKPPKGKVFSNMRRSVGDSEGVDTPLFSTMMVVSQSNEENIQRETNRVSPNPQEVLSKEMEEHMGEKAATTFASTEKDSSNISKTFPMATLGEKSTKGPRCQETKGVDGASARQKATTKRSEDPSRMGKTSKKGEDSPETDDLMEKHSKDPSRVGKTPKEGEDRYTYWELIEALANINVDVVNQGKEIKALQQVVISQQEQISKLKHLVSKLIAKKKRKQFVLRRRNGANKKKEENASKKGENSSSKQKDQQVVGEFVEERAESVEEKAQPETVSAAETTQAAVTGLTSEEVEVAEMLVKAKNDTPKAKGVVINEGGAKKVEKKDMAADVKRKGKEKMLETDPPNKKEKLIESDEALAKRLQEELDQAEKEQVEKDREIARALANELNQAFQKGLETEKAKARAISLRKAMMARSSAKKRRPSQTYLATQERNKMITFLRNAIGVKKEMFIKMTFEQVKGLYEKEMGKLKNNEKDRVEFEKRKDKGRKEEGSYSRARAKNTEENKDDDKQKESWQEA